MTCKLSRGWFIKTALLFSLSGLSFLTHSAQAQEPRAYSDFGAMGTAKVLCSAVFVSGRDLDEALRNSAFGFLSTEDWKLLQAQDQAASDAVIELDLSARQVSVTLHGFKGRAKYFGDQGCVILPFESNRVFFEPVEVRSKLPDPATQPWPMGNLLPRTPLPDSVDAAKVRQAVDAAFEGEGLTAAFVVVHRGRIIGERYGQGADQNTQLESWSMGKSLTATLLGVLVQQGHFGLHDPAPVEPWRRDPEDPRAKIKISDLLRMSSGLLFSHASQPRYEWGRAIADHLYIYAGGIDAFH